MSNEPPTPGGTLRPGMLVAERYQLIEHLGGGGMGEVFLAQDRRLQRPVALKRLLPHLVDRADLVLRSEREGQILASLDHPAINRVHDMLDSPDGGKFLILEYVHGRSFAAEIRATGRVAWDRCAGVGVQVCGALAAAHAAGVVHRDIKPANILIKGDDGSVRVADFGIARLTTSPASIVDGSFIGTPDYWAPEQATGGEATASSDLYSLCCVLYEAACGRPPFVAGRDAAIAAAFLMHVTTPVPDPQEIAPDLPDEARDILMRGLAKNPRDRFGSATELRNALAGSRTAARTPTVKPPPAAPAETVISAAVLPPPPPPPAPPAETPDPVDAAPSPRESEPVRATRLLADVPTTADPPKQDAPDPAPKSAAASAAPPTRMSRRGRGTVASASSRADATRISSPAPTAATGPRRVNRRTTVLIGAAAAAALIVGGVLGLVSAPSDTPAAPAPVVLGVQDISAGHVRTAVPSDWTVRTAAADRSKPFALRDAVELRPPGAGPGEAVVVGTSTATGLALLPAGLPADRRAPVAMGALAGYRYTGISAGGRAVTAYVAPATDGVTTVVCPAAPADGGSACNALVARLALDGASGFPLTPGRRETKRLRAALASADAALGRAGAISRASSAAGQAAAARTVAAALRGAAVAVPGRGDASPAVLPAMDDLRSALGAQAAAYDALASAARSVDSPRWNAARAALTAAGPRVRSAVAELVRAGYSVT